MGALFDKYLKGDRVIWMIVIFLYLSSLLLIYSSSSSLAFRYHGGNTTYFLIKQLVFLLVAFIVMWTAHLIKYSVWYRLANILLALSVPLLGITLLFGRNLNAASRWLEIPGLGISFQSSDLAKVILIMYVAKYLSQMQENTDDFKQFLIQLIAPVAFVCALILPANFSTAALLGLTCWLMMFVGRVNLKYLFGITGIGIVLVGAFIAISLQFKTLSRAQTWVNRIENFISDDKTEGNYQLEQSKIAIATGGIIGKGPGRSTQRNFLPHPYSDFIYAIIIEEYGVVGGVFTLILYLMLLYRAALLVKKSNRLFPAFLAFGLALMLTLQALINMAVAVGAIPVTGQPLPLVSLGGSSLIVSSGALGIILGISRSQDKKELFDGEEPVKDNN
ncbi:FtsW/RodA/SpoVE family cell cycle protein [Tenuifilum sp.]|uniref:FtsW/RodA/SpoVE family cell cycle protein n=2 Tax=Tenuifilum sp. TaxID=2760880 RepID=UPI001B548602|nr:FtsW/RodA/SpoVE family cell cycle protein [Bacteroidales bacterium]HON71239.1 FtsW/RodA/SpoVE family cell cycle protein [Tenuifilum sp.]HOU74334.1 FtsW/RodA/SpoVE family cell cycle protein [Tenuifilum sp.]HQE54722.1 FtsW/RodA/SpoVE family cell cycle protein [Tenuifilum sp.]HQG72823.1 FtsW/RodA/SpoVE family cell cycle protein [Tenuifilum sp.]